MRRGAVAGVVVLTTLAACSTPASTRYSPRTHPAAPATSPINLAAQPGAGWTEREALARCELWRADEVHSEQWVSPTKDDAIRALAVSADGRVIAVARHQRVDVFAGDSLAWLGGISSTIGRCTLEVFGLALAPDGRWLALRQFDGVRIWDLREGSVIADYTELYADYDGNKPRLFDFDSGSLVVSTDRGLRVHTPQRRWDDQELFGAVAISRNLHHAVLTPDANTQLLVDLRDTSVFVLSEGELFAAAFSPASDLLATAVRTQDGAAPVIELWNVKTLDLVATGALESDASCASSPTCSLAFSIDGRWLLVAGSDPARPEVMSVPGLHGRFTQLQPLAGRGLVQLRPSRGGFVALDSQLGLTDYGVAADGSLSERAHNRIAPALPYERLDTTQLSSDGRTLARVRAVEGRVDAYALDARFATESLVLRPGASVPAALQPLAPQLFPLITGEERSSSLWLFDAATHSVSARLERAPFTPQIHRTRGGDAAALLLPEGVPEKACDAGARGERPARFELLRGPLQRTDRSSQTWLPLAYALSPDGTRAASQDCLGVRLYDVDGRSKPIDLHRPANPRQRVQLEFTASGRHVVLKESLGYPRARLRAHALAGGKPELIVDITTSWMNHRLSRNGRFLALASNAGTWVWDLEQRGTPPEVHPGEAQQFAPLAVSDDGKRVFVRDQQGEAVYLWTGEDGGRDPLLTGRYLMSAELLADSDVLVVAGSDRITALRLGDRERVDIRSYQLSSGELAAIAESPRGLFAASEPLLAHRLYRRGGIFGGELLSADEVARTYLRPDLLQLLRSGQPLNATEARR